MNRIYAAYCRSATRAQCSPVGGVAFIIVIAVSILAVRYGAAVAEAVRIAAACVLCATGLAMLGAVAWWANCATCRAAATPKPAPVADEVQELPAPAPAAPEAELAALADQLADERTLIRLTPDGAGLEAVRRSA